MLEDIYLEYMVKKKKSGGQKTLIIGLAALGVVLTIGLFAATYVLMILLMNSQYRQIVMTVGLLLIALMWYGYYLIFSMQNIEYEYILTNSEMDIDKVMSKKGRKHLVSLDFKEISVCANVEDAGHNSEYKNVKPDKVIDASGNKEHGNIYFVDFAKEGVRTRVIFQPTMKMISAAKKFNPRNIYIMEE